ncbi:UvrD-helicase domain-containing protein [Lentisphaera profundi]|uniref:DNA 3'-5' helicase n=1 Tax=Lentisphaera profundi TaxID=1658616 RepID=A0ABY7VZK3_9BACT|nr:UvrD-helicase domain-containing protein [Lentisphaera profundi]WDE98635.1 UvrD-helicase domain-containing protein [Lentisphaera profundi]
MSVLLDRLNDEQRQAVMTTEKPLLILAGAGTGKTMVVTSRIAFIVQSGRAEPDEILAVTFTNKAANEMKERAGKLIGQKAVKDLWVSTFHSFGMKILRKYAYQAGYAPNFTLAEYGDQVGLVKQGLNELGLIEDGMSQDPKALLSLISMAKAKNQTPEDLEESGDAWEQRVGSIYRYYQEYLHALNIMDFDDLLMLTVRLLQKDEKVRSLLQQKFKYVMVDEFQDTNHIQMELLHALLPKENPNICVVGDDDQSIYSWRGAEVANILSFPEIFPGGTLIKLEQNYRSTNVILNAANKVISINSQRHVKNLWSAQEGGEKLKVVACGSEEREAKTIADSILNKVNGRENTYGDCAILYRSNHQSRALEDAMRRGRIPYKVIGDTSFYERKEVRDAFAFLKIIQNPRDDFSFLRVLDVPPRGIGPRTIKTLREKAVEHKTSVYDLVCNQEFMENFGRSSDAVVKFNNRVAEFREKFQEQTSLAKLVDDYFEGVGYIEGLGRMYKPREDAEKRYKNVIEIVHTIEAREKDEKRCIPLQEYLEAVGLMEEYRRRQEKDEDPNTVMLLTVHASKGLEFPCVYVTGMEKNLFPHEKSSGLKALAEERRLFYVALTRAKSDLILTWAKMRKAGRRMSQRMPSQFLGELPADLVDHCRPQDLLKKLSKEEFLAQLKTLKFDK